MAAEPADLYDPLAVYNTARRYERRFAQAFYSSMRNLARRVTVEEVELLMARGPAGESDLFTFLDETPVIKAERPEDEAARVYYALVEAGAQGGAVQIAGVNVRATLGIISPQVIEAARRNAYNLIREINRNQQRAIRRLVTNAQRDGVPPSALATQLQQVIGLTERQTLAVGNLRQGLIDMEQGRGTRRGLQSRFTLAPKLPRQIDIDRQTGKYADNLLRHRALTIARTETLRATHEGQQMLWEQLARQGVLPPGAMKMWMVTHDERLCGRCEPMHGTLVPVVGGQFREPGIPGSKAPKTAVSVPPLHPGCRCTLVLSARTRRKLKRPFMLPTKPAATVGPPDIRPWQPPMSPIPTGPGAWDRIAGLPWAEIAAIGGASILGAVGLRAWLLNPNRVATKEIQDALKDRFPDKTINLRGADPRVAQQISVALVEISETAPGLMDKIKRVRVKNLPGDDPGVIASAHPSVSAAERLVYGPTLKDGDLVIRRRWAEDYDEWVAEARDKHDIGYFAGGAEGDEIANIIRHEIAHFAEYEYIERFGMDGLNGLISRVLDRMDVRGWALSNPRIRASIEAQYQGQYLTGGAGLNLEQFIRRRVDEWADQGILDAEFIRDNLSDYGLTDSLEFIAEALSSAWGPNPKPFAQEIFGELRDALPDLFEIASARGIIRPRLQPRPQPRNHPRQARMWEEKRKTKEVEYHLKTHYPKATRVDGTEVNRVWDLGKMSPRMANEIGEAWQRMEALYPGVAATIEHIGVLDLPDGMLAYTGMKMSRADQALIQSLWGITPPLMPAKGIYFNRKYVRNYDDSLALLTDLPGFTNMTSFRDVLTHEFGHAVKFHTEAILDYDTNKMAQFLFEGLQRSGVPVEPFPMQQWAFENLGIYSTTNVEELFAEMWFNIHRADLPDGLRGLRDWFQAWIEGDAGVAVPEFTQYPSRWERTLTHWDSAGDLARELGRRGTPGWTAGGEARRQARIRPGTTPSMIDQFLRRNPRTGGSTLRRAEPGLDEMVPVGQPTERVVELVDVDDDLAFDILNTLDELAERFPKATELLGRVTNTVPKSQWVKPQGTVIEFFSRGLPGREFSNFEIRLPPNLRTRADWATQMALHRQIDPLHYLPGADIPDLIRHEFARLINWRMGEAAHFAGRSWKEVLMQVLREEGLPVGEDVLTSFYDPDVQDFIRRNVSGMATGSLDSFMVEALAEAFGSNPRPFATNMLDTLMYQFPNAFA